MSNETTQAQKPEMQETVMIPLEVLANLNSEAYLQGWNDAVDALGKVRINAVMQKPKLKEDFKTNFRAAQDQAAKNMDAQVAQPELVLDGGNIVDLPKPTV